MRLNILKALGAWREKIDSKALITSIVSFEVGNGLLVGGNLAAKYLPHVLPSTLYCMPSLLTLSKP